MTSAYVQVRVPEELPEGYIIYSLPAVNPMDGSLVPVTVQGDMKEAFTIDPDTGYKQYYVSYIE